jgi:uncharacterized protein (TIGR02271 family)
VIQTNMQTGTIAGYFENREDAGQAIQALQEAGFTSAHLGVAHRGEWTDSANSSAANASRTASGAGEKTTGTWDKIRNFFEGNTAEPYADERTQGDLANREVTSAPGLPINERNYTGYDNSDLQNSLAGMSVPEDRSRYFGHRFNNSEQGAVVTVNAGDRRSEAESILTRYGADLGENAANYDYAQTDQRTGNVQNTQNIQLLGEVLRVHKDRVSRGEVTIRKEIVTEDQTLQVPVTREEIVIERRQADSSTPASGNIGQNSEIRIPLSEERALVDKSTVVREEVSVGKKRVEEVRDLSDKVRHEELQVEDATAGTRGR